MLRRPQQRENKSLSVARPLAVVTVFDLQTGGGELIRLDRPSTAAAARRVLANTPTTTTSAAVARCILSRWKRTHVTRTQTLLAINPRSTRWHAHTHAAIWGPFWQAASWLGTGRTGAVQEKQSGPARGLGLLCLWSVTLHHEGNLLQAREELWSSGRGVWESPLRLPPMSAPIFWLPTISWIWDRVCRRRSKPVVQIVCRSRGANHGTPTAEFGRKVFTPASAIVRLWSRVTTCNQRLPDEILLSLQIMK